MSFQIKNKNGEALTINDLDQEAATFWNKETHPKNYANPIPNTGDEFKDAMNCSFNWFDIIGWHIHNNKANFYKRYDNTITWDGVKESMLLNAIDVLKDKSEKLDLIREAYKPMLELIDHWSGKGYIPEQIKE